MFCVPADVHHPDVVGLREVGLEDGHLDCQAGVPHHALNHPVPRQQTHTKDEAGKKPKKKKISN